MEYIKKEELIKDEIYKADNGSLTFIMKATKDLYDVINIPSCNEFMKNGNFNGSYLTFINATSEEKHWLNKCIKLNKFITFEEAMKTFIPEYVECIQTSIDRFTKNKIYKVENKGDIKSFVLLDNKNVNTTLPMIGSLWSFKPSTKEAYDAQFVVKEPAENKTELEIWLENTKSLNLSLEDLEKYIGSYQTCNFNNIYIKLEGNLSKGRAKILFDKWNEKVIEPLPQFKVIETIETITKVENNEGNQFFIGDVVISDSGFVQTIKSFRYNVNKDNVLATTNVCNQISIDKIEHYIEPKVEETLLEKAKRLYPIGTKINSLGGSSNQTINSNTPFMSGKDGVRFTMNCLVYLNGKWAEIIE